MMHRIYSLLATLVLLAAVSVDMSAAVQVGTCRNGITSFTTIQAAVNSAPAGSTIFVCAGTYPEQVVIRKPLTLEGAQNGSAFQAVIASPAGGVMQNTTSLSSGAPIAAQVLVADTAGVKLNNLTVDGSNNKINGCSPNLIGIFYQNASGSVSHGLVLNQAMTATDNGCQSGLAIFAQSGNGGTSQLTVSGTHVQNYQKNGITGNEAGTTMNIHDNTVIGQGPTTGAAENSIQIGFGAKGQIISNIAMDDIWSPDTISDSGDAATGILVFASNNVTVANNTVGNTQFGIAIVSDPVAGTANGAHVAANNVAGTHIFDGIDLCSDSNHVHDNTIQGSSDAGVHLDSSCGTVTNNVVIDNTINGACAGLLIGTPSGMNNTQDNELFNVKTTVLHADECTQPLFVANSATAKNVIVSGNLVDGHPRSSPARP